MFPVHRAASPVPGRHSDSPSPDRPAPAAALDPPAAPIPRAAELHPPPEQAWRAATADRPLETPRPLPASWQPLARRLTGTAVRYTTGPATRAALAASGALGATTGRVIHLPREPVAADTELVVHELTHARAPLPRPRFLLGGHSHVDADEQATRQATARTMTAAPEVARLPVGGAAVLVARAPSTRPAVTPAAGQPGPDPAAAAAPAVLAREAARPAPVQASATTNGTNEQPAATIDYDRLLGFLDRWLARELERRGGRYQGVF